MNTFKLICDILQESSDTNPTAIRNNPRIIRIRKKAEAIRARAELLRSKNEMQKAKMDHEKIAAEKSKQHIEIKAKFPKENDVNLNSGNPIKQPVPIPAAPQISRIKENIEEPGNELPGTMAEQQNEEDLSKIPGEEDEEEKPVIPPVAGTESQSKDEAEIAEIQARTREIQAKIGEYSPQGESIPNDEEGGLGGDPSQMELAPDVGGMGGVTDPSMMGGEQENNDPLKGLGDTTDPTSQMIPGMGGMINSVNPMTGLPMEVQPSKTPTAIGRIYMLKKLYYRLSLLDNILRNCPDVEMSEIARITAEAFEIFRIIIQNMKVYKDKIDDVIVDYYMLIRDVSGQAEDHFHQKNVAFQS